MSENDDFKKVLCANPHCKIKYVLEGEIHPTGLCIPCCIRYDAFTCPICWYDEELDG